MVVGGEPTVVQAAGWAWRARADAVEAAAGAVRQATARGVAGCADGGSEVGAALGRFGAAYAASLEGLAVDVRAIGTVAVHGAQDLAAACGAGVGGLAGG